MRRRRQAASRASRSTARITSETAAVRLHSPLGRTRPRVLSLSASPSRTRWPIISRAHSARPSGRGPRGGRSASSCPRRGRARRSAPLLGAAQDPGEVQHRRETMGATVALTASLDLGDRVGRIVASTPTTSPTASSEPTGLRDWSSGTSAFRCGPRLRPARTSRSSRAFCGADCTTPARCPTTISTSSVASAGAPDTRQWRERSTSTSRSDASSWIQAASCRESLGSRVVDGSVPRESCTRLPVRHGVLA
jgi:hypothetical protein